MPGERPDPRDVDETGRAPAFTPFKGTFKMGETALTHLVVLVTAGDVDSIAPAQLGQRSSWLAPLDVDKGGYDFDAKFAARRLHLVYRSDRYAVTRINPSSPASAHELPFIPGTAWSVHADLHHRVIRVESGNPAIVDSLDGIPGCDQPQLQWTNPLTITGERLVAGVFDIGRWNASEVRQVTPRDLEAEKVLIRQDSGVSSGWLQLRLVHYAPGAVARAYARHGQTPWAVEADYDRVYWTSLWRTRQIFYLPSIDNRDEKLARFGFLMAVYAGDSPRGISGARGFLGRLIYQIRPDAAFVHSWQILDTTHEQIRYLSGQPPTAEAGRLPDGYENGQFSPLYGQVSDKHVS